MENNETFNAPPSLEKVQGVIDRLTDGADCVVKKEKYNEAGELIEMEVQISEPDAEGNVRQFDYLVNKTGRMTLDEVWFDADGMPLDGKQVAEYVNGNWQMG
jgi:hypothetical protein